MTTLNPKSVISSVASISSAGFLARLGIRKKLVFLHTFFTLTLAAIMFVFLRPAVLRVVSTAEADESVGVLLAILPPDSLQRGDLRAEDVQHLLNRDSQRQPTEFRVGNAPQLRIPPDLAARAVDTPLNPIAFAQRETGSAILFIPSKAEQPGFFVLASTPIAQVRAELTNLYLVCGGVLLAVYFMVAVAVEFVILPRHFYKPIRSILAADRAVQDRNETQELIPALEIPQDELGEIMRSRNASIMALRQQEVALTAAFNEIERVADDLKKKNFLLEMTRRKLADADRLASLGIMSAGIAHELNTPLAVIKGLSEKLLASRDAGQPTLGLAEAELMLRVVNRLERLSESLLDFARVRPPATRPAEVKQLIDEALTLVRLDRDAKATEISNLTPAPIDIQCDSDRIVQVLVNIIRNALDASRSRPAPHSPAVNIFAERATRQGQDWVNITITDNGPGIEPEILARLFDPFVSTRLDSRGTGLGLAVAEGIVKEHDGLILARNLPNHAGAQFEIVLPINPKSPINT